MKLRDARSPLIDHRPAMISGINDPKTGAARSMPLSARDIEARAKCNVPDSCSGTSIRQSTALLCTSENVAALDVPCAVYYLKLYLRTVVKVTK